MGSRTKPCPHCCWTPRSLLHSGRKTVSLLSLDSCHSRASECGLQTCAPLVTEFFTGRLQPVVWVFNFLLYFRKQEPGHFLGGASEARGPRLTPRRGRPESGLCACPHRSPCSSLSGWRPCGPTCRSWTSGSHTATWVTARGSSSSRGDWWPHEARGAWGAFARFGHHRGRAVGPRELCGRHRTCQGATPDTFLLPLCQRMAPLCRLPVGRVVCRCRAGLAKRTALPMK